MVSVGVRIISWYIWCNFEKFIDYRTRSFIKIPIRLLDTETLRIIINQRTGVLTKFCPIYPSLHSMSIVSLILNQISNLLITTKKSL